MTTRTTAIEPDRIARLITQTAEDRNMGLLLGDLIAYNKRADDDVIKAVLKALTPAQRVDLSTLGATLVQLVNEIRDGEPARASAIPPDMLEDTARPRSCPGCRSIGLPDGGCTNSWHNE